MHQRDVTTKAASNKLIFEVQDSSGGRRLQPVHCGRGCSTPRLKDCRSQVALSARSRSPRPGAGAVAAQARRHLPNGRPERRRPEGSTASRGFSPSRLAAASPGNLPISECLARSHTGLGELCLNEWIALKDAVQHFLKVVQLVEKSAETNPDQAQAAGNASRRCHFPAWPGMYAFDREFGLAEGLVPQDAEPRRAMARR